MAQKCDLCGKGPQFGNNISHAHNTTRRRWNVNMQSVKAVVDGTSKRVRVCTSCIKTARSSRAKRLQNQLNKIAPAASRGLGLFLFPEISSLSSSPALSQTPAKRY